MVRYAGIRDMREFFVYCASRPNEGDDFVIFSVRRNLNPVCMYFTSEVKYPESDE